MRQLLVARFRDGRVAKGGSMDVDANRPVFHLRPEGGGPAMEVRMEELKALFFVRSLDGDPARDDVKTADPGDPRGRGASLVTATFEDGEEISGFTIRYPPIKTFYFLTPVDAGSNNVRILVNGGAVMSLDRIDGAG